ncbi:MAG TPA: hypothetical protein VFL29_13310 [Candidatus Dormibacteraeota bacterium]|nr:hypothetical protein [Candidatus Dormibacteraeota bacterium]
MEGDNPESPDGPDAPVGSAPAYSPPPTSAPTAVPPAYAEQFGAPYAPYSPPPQPAAPRNRGRLLGIIAGVVAVVLLAFVGGAAFANASLSSTYSPQRAVSDYLSAMGRGDVSGMMTNATFLHGDGAYSQFFQRDAVAAMLGTPQNKQISSVRIGAVSSVDDSTSSVNVSLSWGGTSRTLTYKVRKDPASRHYLFYDSWRVQVPFATLNLNLPNQSGVVTVDGIALQTATSGKAEVIQGFHNVTMQPTDFYDASTLTVDGVDSSPAVSFSPSLGATASAAALAAVKASFANIACDPNATFDCPNHRYTVPAGFYDTLPAAGGDIRADSWWSLSFRGDPTAGMKLTVAATPGQVDAAGVCGMTLTVDGTRTYQFSGVWTGTLTWARGAFASHVAEACDMARSS